MWCMAMVAAAKYIGLGAKSLVPVFFGKQKATNREADKKLWYRSSKNWSLDLFSKSMHLFFGHFVQNPLQIVLHSSRILQIYVQTLFPLFLVFYSEYIELLCATYINWLFIFISESFLSDHRELSRSVQFFFFFRFFTFAKDLFPAAEKRRQIPLNFASDNKNIRNRTRHQCELSCSFLVIWAREYTETWRKRRYMAECL